jgi:hypothetical protein
MSTVLTADTSCCPVCCRACGRTAANTGKQPEFCTACARRCPEALLKATYDTFHYALRLRTGEIIRFSRAFIQGEFVHLDLDDLYVNYQPFPFNTDKALERGVDVRLSSIEWVSDGKTVHSND